METQENILAPVCETRKEEVVNMTDQVKNISLNKLSEEEKTLVYELPETLESGVDVKHVKKVDESSEQNFEVEKILGSPSITEVSSEANNASSNTCQVAEKPGQIEKDTTELQKKNDMEFSFLQEDSINVTKVQNQSNKILEETAEIHSNPIADPKVILSDTTEERKVDTVDSKEESFEVQRVPKIVPSKETDEKPVMEVDDPQMKHEECFENESKESSAVIHEHNIENKELRKSELSEDEKCTGNPLLEIEAEEQKSVESFQDSLEDIKTSASSQIKQTIISLEDKNQTIVPQEILDDKMDAVKEETFEIPNVAAIVKNEEAEKDPLIRVDSLQMKHEESFQKKSEENAECTLLKVEEPVESLHVTSEDSKAFTLSQINETTNYFEDQKLNANPGGIDDEIEEKTIDGADKKEETHQVQNVTASVSNEEAEKNSLIQVESSEMKHEEPFQKETEKPFLLENKENVECTLLKEVEEETATSFHVASEDSKALEEEKTIDETHKKEETLQVQSLVTIALKDTEENSPIQVDGSQIEHAEKEGEKTSLDECSKGLTSAGLSEAAHEAEIGDDKIMTNELYSEKDLDNTLLKKEAEIEEPIANIEAQRDIEPSGSGQDADTAYSLEDEGLTTNPQEILGAKTEEVTASAPNTKDETLEVKDAITTASKESKENSLIEIDESQIKHEEHLVKEEEEPPVIKAPVKDAGDADPTVIHEPEIKEEPAEESEAFTSQSNETTNYFEDKRLNANPGVILEKSIDEEDKKEKTLQVQSLAIIASNEDTEENSQILVGGSQMEHAEKEGDEASLNECLKGLSISDLSETVHVAEIGDEKIIKGELYSEKDLESTLFEKEAEMEKPIDCLQKSPRDIEASASGQEVETACSVKDESLTANIQEIPGVANTEERTTDATGMKEEIFEVQNASKASKENNFIDVDDSQIKHEEHLMKEEEEPPVTKAPVKDAGDACSAVIHEPEIKNADLGNFELSENPLPEVESKTEKSVESMKIALENPITSVYNQDMETTSCVEEKVLISCPQEILDGELEEKTVDAEETKDKDTDLHDVATSVSNEESKENLLGLVDGSELKHEEHLERETEELLLTETSTRDIDGDKSTIKNLEIGDLNRAEFSVDEGNTECNLLKEEAEKEKHAESLHVAYEDDKVLSRDIKLAKEEAEKEKPVESLYVVPEDVKILSQETGAANEEVEKEKHVDSLDEAHVDNKALNQLTEEAEDEKCVESLHIATEDVEASSQNTEEAQQEKVVETLRVALEHDKSLDQDMEVAKEIIEEEMVIQASHVDNKALNQLTEEAEDEKCVESLHIATKDVEASGQNTEEAEQVVESLHVALEHDKSLDQDMEVAKEIIEEEMVIQASHVDNKALNQLTEEAEDEKCVESLHIATKDVEASSQNTEEAEQEKVVESLHVALEHDKSLDQDMEVAKEIIEKKMVIQASYVAPKDDEVLIQIEKKKEEEVTEVEKEEEEEENVAESLHVAEDEKVLSGDSKVEKEEATEENFVESLHVAHVDDKVLSQDTEVGKEETGEEFLLVDHKDGESLCQDIEISNEEAKKENLGESLHVALEDDKAVSQDTEVAEEEALEEKPQESLHIVFEDSKVSSEDKEVAKVESEEEKLVESCNAAPEDHKAFSQVTELEKEGAEEKPIDSLLVDLEHDATFIKDMEIANEETEEVELQECLPVAPKDDKALSQEMKVAKEEEEEEPIESLHVACEDAKAISQETKEAAEEKLIETFHLAPEDEKAVCQDTGVAKEEAVEEKLVETFHVPEAEKTLSKDMEVAKENREHDKCLESPHEALEDDQAFTENASTKEQTKEANDEVQEDPKTTIEDSYSDLQMTDNQQHFTLHTQVIADDTVETSKETTKFEDKSSNEDIVKACVEGKVENCSEEEKTITENPFQEAQEICQESDGITDKSIQIINEDSGEKANLLESSAEQVKEGGPCENEMEPDLEVPEKNACSEVKAKEINEDECYLKDLQLTTADNIETHEEKGTDSENIMNLQTKGSDVSEEVVLIAKDHSQEQKESSTVEVSEVEPQISHEKFTNITSPVHETLEENIVQEGVGENSCTEKTEFEKLEILADESTTIPTEENLVGDKEKVADLFVAAEDDNELCQEKKLENEEATNENFVEFFPAAHADDKALGLDTEVAKEEVGEENIHVAPKDIKSLNQEKETTEEAEKENPVESLHVAVADDKVICQDPEVAKQEDQEEKPLESLHLVFEETKDLNEDKEVTDIETDEKLLESFDAAPEDDKAFSQVTELANEGAEEKHVDSLYATLEHDMTLNKDMEIANKEAEGVELAKSLLVTSEDDKPLCQEREVAKEEVKEEPIESLHVAHEVAKVCSQDAQVALEEVDTTKPVESLHVPPKDDRETSQDTEAAAEENLVESFHVIPDDVNAISQNTEVANKEKEDEKSLESLHVALEDDKTFIQDTSTKEDQYNKAIVETFHETTDLERISSHEATVKASVEGKFEDSCEEENTVTVIPTKEVEEICRESDETTDKYTQIINEDSGEKDDHIVSSTEQVERRDPCEDGKKRIEPDTEVQEIYLESDGITDKSTEILNEDSREKDNLLVSSTEQLKEGGPCEDEKNRMEPDTGVPGKIECAEREVKPTEINEVEGYLKDPQMITVDNSATHEEKGISENIMIPETICSDVSQEVVVSMAKDPNYEQEESTIVEVSEVEPQISHEKFTDITIPVHETSEENTVHKSVGENSCSEEAKFEKTVHGDDSAMIPTNENIEEIDQKEGERELETPQIHSQKEIEEVQLIDDSRCVTETNEDSGEVEKRSADYCKELTENPESIPDDLKGNEEEQDKLKPIQKNIIFEETEEEVKEFTPVELASDILKIHSNESVQVEDCPSIERELTKNGEELSIEKTAVVENEACEKKIPDGGCETPIMIKARGKDPATSVNEALDENFTCEVAGEEKTIPEMIDITHSTVMKEDTDIGSLASSTAETTCVELREEETSKEEDCLSDNAGKEKADVISETKDILAPNSSEEVLESVTQVQNCNLTSKQEKAEISEENFEAVPEEIKSDKISSKEIFEQKETTQADVSNEKIKEEDGKMEDCPIGSYKEDVTRDINQENEAVQEKEKLGEVIENEIETKEVSKVFEESDATDNINKHDASDEKAVKELDEYLPSNESIDKGLNHTGQGKSVEEVTAILDTKEVVHDSDNSCAESNDPIEKVERCAVEFLEDKDNIAGPDNLDNEAIKDADNSHVVDVAAADLPEKLDENTVSEAVPTKPVHEMIVECEGDQGYANRILTPQPEDYESSHHALLVPEYSQEKESEEAVKKDQICTADKVQLNDEDIVIVSAEKTDEKVSTSEIWSTLTGDDKEKNCIEADFSADKHVVLQADPAENILAPENKESKESSLAICENLETSKPQQEDSCGNEELKSNKITESIQEPKAKIEEPHAEKSHEAEQEEVKTDEEQCEEEEKSDLSSEAPVIVDAGDADMKHAHKKHGILSGVGSKVKHSISKVKKAITGKASPHKPASPK